MHRKIIFLLAFLFIASSFACSNDNLSEKKRPLLSNGSGSLKVELENGNTIDVFYHKPKTYNVNSPIIFVVPGGGRNGDTYRDTWIEKSEEYGLLVLSPSYIENIYPGPVNYNMAKMMRSTDIAELRKYEVVVDRKEWIFNDFDYIFDMVTKSLSSNQKLYDIFGHSAGGQIVHRLVLFSPENKINRALAANSGWYTSTNLGIEFPYGLKGAPITFPELSNSFSKNLVVFLGELDNEHEKRGHLRKTPETNRQGKGRLERGKYFFETAKSISKNMDFHFGWKLEIVSGVGHSYNEMGRAAADYLYGGHSQELNKTINKGAKKRRLL